MPWNCELSYFRSFALGAIEKTSYRLATVILTGLVCGRPLDHGSVHHRPIRRLRNHDLHQSEKVRYLLIDYGRASASDCIIDFQRRVCALDHLRVSRRVSC